MYKRQDKRRFYHSAHVQITNPFGILTVCLVALLRLCIFGVGKSNPDVILLQDIKNRDPILAGRLHADIITAIFGKPVTQLLQSFCEGRKACLLIFCAVVGISDTNTGKDPCFVDIKSTAVVF